jgi:hypothetical protein
MIASLTLLIRDIENELLSLQRSASCRPAPRHDDFEKLKNGF